MPPRRLAILSFLLVAACSFQRFSATKVVDYALPNTGIEQLVCRSHNGGITVIGDATATEIRVRAEITALASSQAEADALLHQLDVQRDTVDGQMKVAGIGPGSTWTQSSMFTFTITLPPRTTLDLRGHNGDLRLQGTAGDVQAETHNGRILGAAAGARVTAITHNGGVELDLRGGGREVGIETHNGQVVVTLDADHGARVEASTHNGQIRCELPLQDVERERRHLTGRLGDGKGTLRITTHNGDVVLK